MSHGGEGQQPYNQAELFEVGGVKITAHALVRYLERVRGWVGLEEYKAKLGGISDYKLIKMLQRNHSQKLNKMCNEFLNTRLWSRIFSEQTGTFLLGQNFKIIVKDQVIITVSPVDYTEYRRHRAKKSKPAGAPEEKDYYHTPYMQNILANIEAKRARRKHIRAQMKLEQESTGKT